MECCMRPNRSDVHLSKEEEAKIEEATREYFDGIAPKRHTKPQRSEYIKTYTDKRVYTNGSKVAEEFVETEYYKDLNRIDKQHHTTVSGFIAIENMKGKLFSLEPDFATAYHGSSNGNPATNEWIPSADDEVAIIPEEGYGKPPFLV